METLHCFDTEYSADSIEWCPNKSHKAYFVCGTYQLQQNETADANAAAATDANVDADADGDGIDQASGGSCKRKGRIYLFRFDRKNIELKELQRFETAAILDMRWLPSDADDECNVPPTLAAATADGTVELYELRNEELHRKCTLAVNAAKEKLLVLSLDWQSNVKPTNRRLLCSDSTGGLSLLELGDGGGGDCEAGDTSLQLIHSWPEAHGFEAWICAFDKWDVNRVYSGGDDCLLYAYDLRTYDRVLTNKTHMGGVTCLLSHPQRENLLLTGSYDENVRTFDIRSMRQPVSELSLGGGIWRLKAHPLDSDLVLAACMYKNFSIVRLNTSGIEVAAEYDEHESICYGADWCMEAQPEDTVSFCATCSFYDHKLCLASYKHS